MNVSIKRINRNEGIIKLNTLKKLIGKIPKSTRIKLVGKSDDIPVYGMMLLSQESKSLGFLKDPSENVYSVNDLKVRYK